MPVAPRGAARRWAGRVGLVAGLMVLALVAGWSLRTMLAPVPDVLAASDYTLVRAQQGAVSQTLRLNTSVEWVAESMAANQAAGTVTTLDLEAGAEAEAGSRLYTVDLRPVVVAAGEVPTFRDLRSDDRGEDVAQLQELLAVLGYLVGEVDGRFGFGVRQAVRAWQRDLGVADDGVVRRGDVIFVSELPARLALDSELAVGAALAGGEPAVQVLPSVPAFTIQLPEGPARLVSAGMAVEIARPDGEAWWAEVVGVRAGGGPGEEASREAVLSGPDGGPVCRDTCADIAIDEAVLLSSVIHVVPEVAGVTVPVAALVTTGDGTTAVVLPSGELQPVTVLAAASGIAVVEGLGAGTEVRTPGELPANPPDGR